MDPEAPRPIERRGDVNFEVGQYDQAAARYGECLRLDADSPRVLYKLALARYRAGNAAGAVQPLRRAVLLDDHSADAQYLLGLVLPPDSDEALAAMERAVSLAPKLAHAREALAALYSARGRRSDEIAQLEALAALDVRADRQVALGRAYAQAGRTALALTTLNHAAERFPEQPQIYVAIGALWLQAAERGDRVALSKALEALQGSVGADTGSEALMLLGRALLLAGDDDLAERVLQQAAGASPVELDAFRHLADVAERRGHLEVARDAIERLDVLAGDAVPAPERAARASRIGDLWFRTNNPAKAARWFERALGAGESSAARARLAQAQWQSGDRAGAMATIDRGLAADPENATLAALRGRLQSR
jgi:tetratricopeptide (TPR) repeat protein